MSAGEISLLETELAQINDYLRNFLNLVHALYLKTANNSELEADALALRRYAHEMLGWAIRRRNQLLEASKSEKATKEQENELFENENLQIH